MPKKKKRAPKKMQKASKYALKKLRLPKAKRKIKKVMTEFKDGELHSGSKKGPVVTNKKQAIAIALSEAQPREASRATKKVVKKKKKR